MPLPDASPPALPRASGILVYLVLLLGAALLLGLWPELDLLVSRFARELNGGEFQLKGGDWNWLYRGTRPFFLVLSAAVALVGLASFLLRRPLAWLTPRKAIFVLLSFGVTQGLVVDLYLKNVFGRARPRELIEFGGEATFSPFYLVTDQCSRNCSFVSGHAAMIFALFAFAFIAPPRWRWPIVWLVLLLGAVAGWARIVQGAHFASDVVFAGLVTYGVTWLIALVVLRRAVGQRWLERRLGRWAPRVAA